jgi:hypothetical protein
MRFGSRATFLHFSSRWTVLPAAQVKKEERAQQVPGPLAAANVEAWARDVMVWPDMLDLYEMVSGDRLRPPTTLDVEERIKPTLRDAFRRGQLVALKAPVFPSRKKKEKDEGVHIKPDQIEQLLDAIPKKPPKLLKEKSFFDLQVVNTKGKPLAGRRYKLKLPDGKTETGNLGADGRVRKTDIDPGTAELTLLPGEGEVFEVGEDDPSFLEIALVDQDGAPLTGQKYEIELPDGQKLSGTLDDAGTARVDAKTAGNCKVRFPDIDAA